jgi:transglutaminase-like putative cysteine protease
MLLQITHDTHYRYTPMVDLAQHVGHLTPRELPTQRVLRASLDVSPAPDWQEQRLDVFGNVRSYFSIQRRHEVLQIRATSLVETLASPLVTPALDATPAWELVREHFRYRSGAQWDDAAGFSFPSPHVRPHAQFIDFNRNIFTPHRPLLEAAIALMQKIHHGLAYRSLSTDIHTPAHEALARREGVCQDFAHIYLSCVISAGLAARYVSGYLLTAPPEGQAKLIGSDASHAWVSVYLPQMTDEGLAPGGCWIDFDPTNNRWGMGSPGEDYVTLATGRDYSDVSPLRGVLRGGASHTLEVGVTVSQVAAD